MSKDNIQDFLIYQLEYIVAKVGKIKIFDNSFVEKNRDKCKIIYNEKEHELTEYFEVNNNHKNDNTIKIKLKINNNITDINNMFKDCKALLSIGDISNLNNCNNIDESFDGNDSNNFIDESNNMNGDE